MLRTWTSCSASSSQPVALRGLKRSLECRVDGQDFILLQSSPSSLPRTTRGRPGAAGPGLPRACCGRDGLTHCCPKHHQQGALTNWPHQGVVKAALPRLFSCCGLPAGPGVHCSWWHRTAFPGCLLTSKDRGQSGLGPNLLQPELFNCIGYDLIANCGHSLWCWGLRFNISGEHS